MIEEAKTETSKWLKRRSPHLSEFAWQAGYSAFSVSESNIAKARDYIENQEDHHKKTTFKDEFREFCIRHKVDLDERYVWD